jgi:hypothetical protein
MADVTKEIALKVVATDATGPALESLEDKLNAAKKRMVELAAAGQQNTEEFIRLQQEAGEFKRTIEGVEQSVDSVAKSGTEGMQLFGEAVTAVTAGFTIATSVTALYGEENEALQKGIMRVQLAMEILQSITALVALTNKSSALSTTANRIALSLYDKTVKGTTISLKAFKVALATTGIGLIAVGAALAYENWDKLRQLLGLPPDNSKAIQALEREIAVLEAMGTSVELLNEKRITLINLQAEQMKGQEKLNKLNEIDVLNASNSLRIKTANVALDEKSIEVTQQELELLLQKAGYYANVVKESEKLETATKTLTLTSESSFSEIIKKAQELHKEQTDNYKARRALAQSEQEQQAIDAEEAMRLLKLQNDLEKSLIEIKGRDAEEFNDFFRKERDTELNALEYEASQKTLLLQNERATKLAEAALALGDTEDFRKKQLEINQLYDDLETTQDEITAEKRKELKKQERDTTLKFANEAFTGVLGFIAATQGQSEADARKAFNLNKAAGIADATVNTFLGASQALRDPKLPTLAKAFAVAGIIASGLTQVRKIAATQFKSSGGGGGGTGPSGNIVPSGGNQTPAPPVFSNPNVTDLSGFGGGQGQANQPMRAYVVERDIQQTTSRVRRLSEFATLG